MTWTIVTAGAIAALFGYALGHLRAAGFPDVRIRLVEALAEADGLRGQLDAERAKVDGARELYLKRLDRCIGCATCNPDPHMIGEPQSFTDAHYDPKLIGDA